MIEQLKDIAYGYFWNCEHCGEENAYGLDAREGIAAIEEWAEDNADLIAEGEDAQAAIDWQYNVAAEEHKLHREEQQECRSCGRSAG